MASRADRTAGHLSQDQRFDSFAPFVALTFLSMAAVIVLLQRSSALFPVLSIICGLSGIAVVIFGRGRRLAKHLLAREREAKHMALHDGLTGLPNRLLFMDRLGQSLQQVARYGGSVAILALDLDRFKDVNDTYGHQLGDELLRQVAKRIGDACRATDTFARLGGDEFAIVQPSASGQSAVALSQRIIQALATPFDLTAGRVFIGCSVGIALVGEAHVSSIDALRQADLALYRAKSAGGGQFVFFKEEMDAALRMRREVETELREALACKGLTMAYETQFGDHGQISAVEAVVTWSHPARGAVSSDFFIPIAEECGLIEQLSTFVLRSAFADAAKWPEQVKVAVNLSPAHVKMRGFVNTVADLIRETGATPSRFELEISESLFFGEDANVRETLKQLRQMGFALALDDFGTGYSSIQYLRHCPVDKIKIDRSLVARLGSDTQSDAVVDAIIKLAGAFKMAVVAEGVETDDQRRRLRDAGCANVQGLLVRAPVPAVGIDRLVGRAV